MDQQSRTASFFVSENEFLKAVYDAAFVKAEKNLRGQKPSQMQGDVLPSIIILVREARDEVISDGYRKISEEMKKLSHRLEADVHTMAGKIVVHLETGKSVPPRYASEKEVLMNPRKAFEQVLKQAIEFHTEEARNKYFEEHPDADKSKHTVKKEDKEEKPKKPSKKERAEAPEREHQNSEAYKTEKSETYHPSKMPEGMKLPDMGVSAHFVELTKGMPDEDLTKDKAYNHPAVKKLTKKLLADHKKGKLAYKSIETDYLELEEARSKMVKKFTAAKSDAEADPYRFAMRKLQQTWRAYNAAMQQIQDQGGTKKTAMKLGEEIPMNPRKAFEQALCIEKVVNRYAVEFPTEEAKAEYLKKHPGADKSKHTVKKTEAPSGGKDKPSSDEEKRKKEDELYGPEKFTPAEHHKDTGRKLREWQSPDSPILTEVGASFANGKPVSREKLLGAARELKALKDDPIADEHDKKDLDRLSKYLTDLYEQDEPKAKKRKKSASIRWAFEQALRIERVAMEFPTEEAKAEYLKDHPGADKSKHTVKKTEEGGTSKAEADFSDLPKDLTKLTKTQTEKVINHMVKWPLKKLRKHQDLVNKQIEKAHGDKNDEALSNLRVQQKHLDAAVDKKEFGD